MKLESRQVRKVHRILGLIFSVSLLMSAGSGVLHNVMSRTQAPPPKAQPSGKIDPSQIKVSVADAYAKLSLQGESFDAVSIRSIGGLPWYQFMLRSKEQTYYVNALTGDLDEAADEKYATEIASNHLGGAAVRKTDLLTAYNTEYINIFRILPVYRFDADDDKGTRLYVSTMTGSVTRDTNDHKQFEASVFSNVHKLMFIKDKDLRDLVLTFFTAGTFAVAVLGLVLFFMTQPKK
jgi:hypothetical protein